MGGVSVNEQQKIEKAKIILEKIAKGVDPLTGEQIEGDSFLNDPRMIRCFYFVAEVLDNVNKGVYSSRGNNSSKFFITEEQKRMVEFPPEKIGVNEFSKRINACIDPAVSKKLTGTELNKKLKKLGILSEEQYGNGKTRATTNDRSAEYGFELEKKSYSGVEYNMVVINDIGKKYLLENIEQIMDA